MRGTVLVSVLVVLLVIAITALASVVFLMKVKENIHKSAISEQEAQLRRLQHEVSTIPVLMEKIEQIMKNRELQRKTPPVIAAGKEITDPQWSRKEQQLPTAFRFIYENNGCSTFLMRSTEMGRLHSHDRQDIVLVPLRSHLLFRLKEREAEAVPGQPVVIPRGTLHALETKGGGPLDDIFVLASPRLSEGFTRFLDE